MSLVPHLPGVVGHRTYSALVEDDTDLVGHVAYALYKRDKLNSVKMRKYARASRFLCRKSIRSYAVATLIHVKRPIVLRPNYFLGG